MNSKYLDLAPTTDDLARWQVADAAATQTILN